MSGSSILLTALTQTLRNGVQATDAGMLNNALVHNRETVIKGRNIKSSFQVEGVCVFHRGARGDHVRAECQTY
jgi:hypothetical protein